MKTLYELIRTGHVLDAFLLFQTMMTILGVFVMVIYLHVKLYLREDKSTYIKHEPLI